MRILQSFCAGCSLVILALIVIDPPASVVPAPLVEWVPVAHAGSAVLGGRRVSCRFGKVVINNKLPDLGMAARGTIWLNRKLLGKHSGTFQQFVFLHECAHQYTWDESEADCWAIKRGVYRGLFSRRDVNQICQVMRHWKGGLWHNAGPGRCAGIKQCYVQATKSRKSERRAAIRKTP